MKWIKKHYRLTLKDNIWNSVVLAVRFNATYIMDNLFGAD